jgi:hypothetical protein
MAQSGSRRPVTVETRVRARISPRGISKGRSGTGEVVFRVVLFSHVSIIVS